MDTKAPQSSIHQKARSSPQSAMVWDLPLRLFHWSLVVVVSVAGITGFLSPEWWLDVHVIAGYALGILLAFRVVWGVLGSHYSKFGSFPFSIGKVFHHFDTLISRTPHKHIGHNPVGAWMIVILLLNLAVLVVTGIISLGGQENFGPLASSISSKIGAVATNLHEIASWGLLAAVAIHLSGVFVETFVFRQPLVLAMITGTKTMLKQTPAATDNGHGKRGIAVFLTTAFLILVGGLIFSSFPPSGWKEVRFPTNYASECGDCHDAYHPSLRTRETWQSIMSGLSDHYGEDASLDSETEKEITAFLTENSADLFDTEVAHRVGKVLTPSFRMTGVQYWKERHKDISKPTFQQKNIGSKVNCSACHSDAVSGRFDDYKIHIPNGDKK
ncbi:MAG: cytochrome b/b6 domain-containing protein [Alphaproteobacteria bacterium]|nr:cytochrome b/b6 domain-containing protein [Rhodospirillales bacterium]MCW9046170.1 cytochrome b/b6 domain-containing protein [Alphaproteobacteria bacterium]